MTQAGHTKTLPSKSPLTSGWILVTALLLLCITGAGLTWWNYSAQVFSSAQGMMVNEGGEQHVVVMLPASEARVVKIGHGATVTVVGDKNAAALKGRVISVNPTSNADRNVIIIRLMNVRSSLPTGASCEVTIDTTIPPMEGNY